MIKNRTRFIAISVVLGFIVFIGIAILTSLFSTADLPVQISGALLEAVVTALITYFLLAGQTGQEEMKERNVKVFEEKSERFNHFIDKLWEIWDDRSVSLEELNTLIKLVSKEIVMYTKPETVDKILINLINIAEYAKPDKTDSNNRETTLSIQKNIFDIINELAKEIGLGGEIKPGIREKLNVLENKVVPYLIQRSLKQKYIENFKQTINNEEDTIFTDIEYKNGILLCQIKNSSSYLKIDSLEREQGKQLFFGLCVGVNQNYDLFRGAAKGWKKWFFKDGYWIFNDNEFINFTNPEQVEQLYRELNSDTEHENAIAKKAIELCKNWRFNGRNIEEIIAECEK